MTVRYVIRQGNEPKIGAFVQRQMWRGHRYARKHPNFGMYLESRPPLEHPLAQGSVTTR